MSYLLLAPHSDDEVLFASFSILHYQPDIVIIAGDPDRRIREIRERETRLALNHLGARGKVWWWPHVEGQIDKRALKHDLLDTLFALYGTVFAPAVEPHGHLEHNMVGEVALEVYGPKHVVSYLTYTRDRGRSRDGKEVPFLAPWVSQKLQALSFYKSQIAHPERQPWFTSLIDLREWVA